MARANRNTELMSHLRKAELIIPSVTGAVSVALTAIPAAGATTLTVDTVVGLTTMTGRDLLIGRGERREAVKVHASTAPTGTTITLDPTTPVQWGDHAVTDPVTLGQSLDLAVVHSDGLSITQGGEPMDVTGENQAFVAAQKDGHAEMVLEFGLQAMIVDNYAAALGILASRITGAGSAADPRELFIDVTDSESQIHEETNACWRFTGMRKDRTVLVANAFACETDPTSLALELGRTVNSKVPVRLKVTGGILYTAAL